MRSFTPRIRGVHTLPFQAHPRVRLHSKKAVRALTTFFELRRPLRAETESVLFPWRCFPARLMWLVIREPPQNDPQPLTGEPPASRPALPLPAASSRPCDALDAHLRSVGFKRPAFTSSPDSCHESCGANFRASPSGLRAAPVAPGFEAQPVTPGAMRSARRQ